LNSVYSNETELQQQQYLIDIPDRDFHYPAGTYTEHATYRPDMPIDAKFRNSSLYKFYTLVHKLTMLVDTAGQVANF